MTSPPASSCSVEGAQYLIVSADENDICTRFQSRLVEHLGEDVTGQLQIALTIVKSGTIDAEVASGSNEALVVFPITSVDVMDRSLDMSDVERLADAVAETIKNGQNSALLD